MGASLLAVAKSIYYNPLICVDATKFVLLNACLYSYRDDLSKSLFKITAQVGKKAIFSLRASLKNVIA